MLPDTPPGAHGLRPAAAAPMGSEAPCSQLICRVRPCEKPSPLISVLEKEARIEVGPEKGQPGEPLRFDRLLHAHGPGEQEELFDIIRPAVAACLQGTSCTVVAHGGPQCGKSYSLSGFFTHGQLHGLAPRAIQHVVELLEQGEPGLPQAVEASFFEIQGDAVCDLAVRGCPKVSMRELPHPPYVTLDSSLTAHRCDGAASFNRLLDTYFTGLEHRRKGSHTCFQIAFLAPDGRQLSQIRFIEMAWPRPQAGTSTSAANSPAQGKVAATLEQVLQGKLVAGPNSAQVCRDAYRASQLALLLKPCFEGSSLLYFIYCLRLEHIQLPCLAAVAPLLAKLHLWLGVARTQALGNVAPGPAAGLPDDAAASKARKPAVVPPLRLGGGDAAEAAPAQEGAAGDHASATGGLSAASGGARSAHAAAPPPGMEKAHTQAWAQEHVDKGQAAALGPSPPPEETGHADPPNRADSEAQVQDTRMLQQCTELLEAKRHVAEALRFDAARSAALLRDLDGVLGQLLVQRDDRDGGPNERETNFKILYERVYRSMQRATDEISRMHEDIEVLGHFCGGTGIPPAYDSYNVQAGDLQQIAALAQSAPEVAATSAAPEAGSAVAPGGGSEPAPGAAAGADGKAKRATVVPALALSLLPQEHPTHEPQPSLQGPGTPSSASSCSDRGGAADVPRFGAAGRPARAQRAPAVATPGVPLAWPMPPMQMQVVGPAPLMVAPPQHMGSSISVPMGHQTPPVAAPQESVYWQPQGGAASPAMPHSMPPRRAGPLVAPPSGYDSLTPTRTGLPGPGARSPQLGPGAMQRSVSAMRLPGASISAQAADPSAAVMKSHSTANLRTFVAKPFGAPAGGHMSPLMGTRSAIAGVSPMRSASVTAISGAAAAGGGQSVAASAGTSPMPKARQIGNPSPVPSSAGVARPTVPIDRMTSAGNYNSRSTAPVKSRSGAVSPSPAMMGRQVPAAAPRHAAGSSTPALKTRGTAAAPKQQQSPSPERRTTSPLRAASVGGAWASGNSIVVPAAPGPGAADMVAAANAAYGWMSPAQPPPPPVGRQASVGPSRPVSGTTPRDIFATPGSGINHARV